ncbi:hypothetical protein EZV62_007862 [Acer yangbiense]|uniref:RecA family profile 1 domain-containing protein n=1 Tax=Acer yangbiense TaxID=1000413 RepID=A0A5C7IBJ7_9ROSI|nr:hypothetical protein EZV62_007862 [Acer yangbiense]
MDSLVSPLKLKLDHHCFSFHSKTNPSLFSLSSCPLQCPSSPSRFSTSSKVAAVRKPIKKIHCEFDDKLNGAFFSDSDPRFIDRQKALEAAMNDINNSFGKGSVTRLGSAGGALVETFPSGCLTLDLALGGGLPKGRIVEIFGPESSGKTTIALHAIAEVQKLGGNAMLVDAEHAFDPAYSKALGVDVENLIVCQPDNGEMALENRMCRSGAVDLICVDSVSALTPRAEIEGEIGMQQMGLQARLMSQALRKMSGNASKAGCTLIFLNQIRYKIGVYYGNPEVTSGGIALKFFASVRLEIRSTGKIKSVKGDEDIGLRVRVRVQKSKVTNSNLKDLNVSPNRPVFLEARCEPAVVSRPYKQAEFEIIFGEGVSKLGCILDCAEMMDVVIKKGAWYSYGDHRVRLGSRSEVEVAEFFGKAGLGVDIAKAEVGLKAITKVKKIWSIAITEPLVIREEKKQSQGSRLPKKTLKQLWLIFSSVICLRKRLGQGRDKALQYLRDNPLLHDEIEKIVRSMMSDGTVHQGAPFLRNISEPHEDENILEEI